MAHNHEITGSSPVTATWHCLKAQFVEHLMAISVLFVTKMANGITVSVCLVAAGEAEIQRFWLSL